LVTYLSVYLININNYKNMTEDQRLILEGVTNMYETIGEMVPVKFFNSEDLDVLVELKKIVIFDNPYNIGDDFFGLFDKDYPMTFFDLMDHRKLYEDN